MKTLSPLKAGLFVILASSVIFTTTVSARSTRVDCEHSRGEFHRGDFHSGNFHKGESRNASFHKGNRMEHRGMDRMFDGLNLTDAQKADVKKVYAEHKYARTDDNLTREARFSHRNEMQALITAATFDEAQAKTLIAAQQEQRQTQMIERMEMQNKIYNLLTPEQQVKFKARCEAHTAKEPRG